MRTALLFLLVAAVAGFGWHRTHARDAAAARRYVVVPHLVGRAPDDAMRAIVAAGLCPGGLHDGGAARAFAVAATKPAAGTRVAPLSEVELAIAGPPDAGITITEDLSRSACRVHADADDLAEEP